MGFFVPQGSEESQHNCLLKDGESFRLDECAVALSPDLSKIAHRRARGIGNKVEAVPGAGQRSNVHFDRRRVLNEVSGELVLRIGRGE